MQEDMENTDRGRTILYIGGFELPDKNAAAQRVIGVAQILRELGKSVVFYNEVQDAQNRTRKTYFGFQCIEDCKSGQLDYLVVAKKAIAEIESIKPDVVIMYNYPAIAMMRIKHHCDRKNISCIADVTEWYKPHGNILHKLVMVIDINLRMRFVHYHMDSLIVISKYLSEYYKKRMKTALIPPVVDCSAPKWQPIRKEADTTTRFVYAGAPSRGKERLDLIISAFKAVSKKYAVSLSIIGITEEQYVKIYSDQSDCGENIHFLGKIPHMDVIHAVKSSDWTIIIRDNSRLVQAGFPTKLVESISCGTPVIVNNFSNVLDYLDDDSCILSDVNHLEQALQTACVHKTVPERNIFDYRNFVDELKGIL